MTVRTVLTTGANSGIGLATTLEFARRGYDSVGSVRSREKAAQVNAAAKQAGLEVRTVLLDVGDSEACESVIKRLKPYALVNNAGYPATGAIEDVDDRQARLAVETMVLAPMRLARLAIPYMRDLGGGRIVNVSSIAGIIASPLAGWYHGCKHALEALSDSLRMELASSGIRVILIEPGSFKTDIWDENEKALAGHAESRYEKGYSRIVAGARATSRFMGEPASVARVIGGAVSGTNPKPRYLVGYDAHLLAALERISPTAVKDRVNRAVFGL